MSSTEEISKLSERAKQAQDKVAAANQQARSDLEKSVAESRAAAEAKASELQSEAQGTEREGLIMVGGATGPMEGAFGQGPPGCGRKEVAVRRRQVRGTG